MRAFFPFLRLSPAIGFSCHWLIKSRGKDGLEARQEDSLQTANYPDFLVFRAARGVAGLGRPVLQKGVGEDRMLGKVFPKGILVSFSAIIAGGCTFSMNRDR